MLSYLAGPAAGRRLPAVTMAVGRRLTKIYDRIIKEFEDAVREVRW
jgi:hypothetical protein